jgi:putative transcriptional regulator
MLPPMKLQLKIQQVAKRRGINTAYKLQKAAKLTPTNASRLFNHEVKQLSLETLGKLCDVLDCEVGDLIVKPKRRRAKA